MIFIQLVDRARTRINIDHIAGYAETAAGAVVVSVVGVGAPLHTNEDIETFEGRLRKAAELKGQIRRRAGQ